ncbi:MAG: type II toxin-antitoxin system RelE/ParE family toxin [Verrucomicrobiales bacterium]
MSEFAIVVTQRAEGDLLSAAEWIARVSPQAAHRWLQEIRGAMEGLNPFPGAHPFARENPTHERELRQLSHGNYRIIYFVDDSLIVVASVRHTKREPHAPGELDTVD